MATTKAATRRLVIVLLCIVNFGFYYDTEDNLYVSEFMGTIWSHFVGTCDFVLCTMLKVAFIARNVRITRRFKYVVNLKKFTIV